MKSKAFSVITAIIIALSVVCAAICGWQTAHFMTYEAVFAPEHPTYVAHSWTLLVLLLAIAVLACGQTVLPRRPGLLSGILSGVITLLAVLALRFAADQHYHLGMLVSDYDISAAFEGGWLLLILTAALILAAVTQLLMLIFSALAGQSDRTE